MDLLQKMRRWITEIAWGERTDVVRYGWLVGVMHAGFAMVNEHGEDGGCFVGVASSDGFGSHGCRTKNGEDGVLGFLNFYMIYALMDEGDRGIGLSTTSSSFWMAWIGHPHHRQEARCRQPWLPAWEKTMEHHTGAPAVHRKSCTCNV
ncbi:hypothetical protein ACLOJK_024302 [Asimina triloba]